MIVRFFGGPDDGAKRELTRDEVEAGFVDTVDAAGKSYRYVLMQYQDGSLRLEPAAEERP